MNITVAQRVIGGFVIISVLLIIIGATALLKLGDIDTAAEDVNTLAVPTLQGSSRLEISLLSMGRLAVESYYESDSAKLATQKRSFSDYSTAFEDEYNKLRGVVANEANLRTTLSRVEGLFQQYTGNVESLYNNRSQELDMAMRLDDLFSDIEDNADDASTYLLDFSDLDEVADDAALSQAAEVGGQIETSLLSLLTVSADYIKTENLVRADTIGSEVTLVVNEISEQITQMQTLAGGRDDSGTLDEISDLIQTVLDSVNAPNGMLATQVNRLEKQIAARDDLNASDQNIIAAMKELDQLLDLADKLTDTSEEAVDSAVSSGFTMVILFAIASVVIAAFIGFSSVRAITVPLSRVNEILHVISSGNLTQRLDDSSKDEFGELATSVNNLVDSLKSLISGISSRATQLAAASEQTSAVTTQTTASIDEQKSQVSQVATATTEMHSTSQNVTQSAEDTLNQIRHADAEAEKVKGISLENKNTIEVLAKDVDQAAAVINKLHEDSASIGGILDVIRGVADQTNLLALNAAIEAARAGEQGRGFAVVADEVRTLASRTQESTQEINAMIEVLQAGAEKAVTVMNQGKEQTTVCVEQTERASQALDLITEAVHRAHDVSTQIEQSAREQNVVSQEISEKLENIVGIAEETALGAKQTSESSSEVAKLAEELQSSIKQFKV